MQLIIEHNVEETENSIVYRGKWRLGSGGDQVSLTGWLASQTLFLLASRWFLIHGNPAHRDANRDFLSSSGSFADVTLADLRSGYEIRTEDPLLIAAFDELVTRACAMIDEDLLYRRYLSSTAEMTYSLKSLRPSGAAMRNLDDDTKKRADSR